jgi:hypothetical protein
MQDREAISQRLPWREAPFLAYAFLVFSSAKDATQHIYDSLLTH